MLLDLPHWRRLGKGPTGLPGSRRLPFIMSRQSVFTVPLASSLTLDQGIYENNSDLVLFVEQIMIQVARPSECAIQLRPTNSEPWSNRPVPIWVGYDNQTGTQVNTNGFFAWNLPEPFPMPPRSSIAIHALNTHASLAIGVSVGVVGYYETEPAYSKPRIVPYQHHARITASLANGSDTRFQESDLYVGFPVVLEHLRIRGMTATYTGNTEPLLARLNLKGQARIMESRIPMTCLADLRTMAIPMFDAEIDATRGLSIDVENRSGNALAFIDACAVGWRRAA